MVFSTHMFGSKASNTLLWLHRKQACTWYTDILERKAHKSMKLYVCDPAAKEMVPWVNCLICRGLEFIISAPT